MLFLAGLLLLVFFIKTPEAIPFRSNDTKPVFNARASAQGMDNPSHQSHSTPEKNHGKHAGKLSFPGFPVDLNRASLEDLMMLPGVGEKTAGRIMEKRKEIGGFKTVDDLLEVKGIGHIKYERMQQFVKVSGIPGK